jgi:hypothetical protein
MSPGELAGADAIGHTVVERPPPGLARGHFPAPAGVVAALGVIVVIASASYMTARLRRRSKR